MGDSPKKKRNISANWHQGEILKLSEYGKIVDQKIPDMKSFLIGREMVTWDDLDCGDTVSAYSVAECGALLPKELYIPYKGNSGRKRKYPQHPHFFFSSGGKAALVNYTGGDSRERLTQMSDTEADARGKMLIFLVKKGLLTPSNEKGVA